MRSVASLLGYLLLSAVTTLVAVSPAAAQFPESECDPSASPANAPIPPALFNYCATNTAADCDLEISNWDSITHRSPDIRIGDPFTITPEQPRFFLDIGTPADPSDDRFYTKLYVKFRNAGGGLGGGGPAPATEVTVDFSYKEANSPADISSSVPWTPAGTMVATVMENTYHMNIPAPATDGILVPGDWHLQQRGVCWSLSAGAKTLPKKFILRAELHWGQDNDTTTNTAYSFYDLMATGRKAQIGFALDLSGSMNAAFEGSTRLTIAKQKAAMFATLVEDDNQLGVFSFNTGNAANSPFTASYNTPPTAPVSLGDTSVISAMQTVSGDIQRGFIAGQIDNPAVTASGCTPVGQGLLRARQAINTTSPPAGPPTPGKAVVLFSDGMQNIPPFVNSTPPWTCGSSPVAPIINAVQTFADEDINIYSIFFGPEVGWAFSLMNEIKTQTAGDYVYGASSDVELASAYYAIRGLVDDMIYFEKEGTAPVNAPWPTFEVEFDAAASVATAAVAWPYGTGNTRLALDRRLKGTSDWQSCEQSQDATAAAYQPASFLVCRFTPGANSTWEFQVRQGQSRSRSPISYTAAVFSEVQEVQIFPSLDDTTFTAGDALTIHAELRSAGQPVFGATVTANVRVPSRSFSTTLHKYAGRFANVPTDPDANRVSAMASQLSQFLAKDTGSDDIYVYRTVSVSLRDDGQGADTMANDGIYSGELPSSETRSAGDYEVTITAQATLAGGRTVERIAKLATICNVGPADKNKSLVTVDVSPDPIGDVRIATVTVVPFDKFGNAAFPGSGSRIDISAVGATQRGDLFDNLDASFSQRFALAQDDAKVTVSVGEVSLGTRPFVKGRAAGRELSFHLGAAIPHGAFGNTHSSGSSIALDYAWRLDPNLALRAELALDRFDEKAGGSANLTSFTTHLQYRYPVGQWEPYFESGVGVYDLENASTAFGFSVGLGIRRQLSPNWLLDLSLQGHHVSGNLDLGFSRIRAGGIYEIQP